MDNIFRVLVISVLVASFAPAASASPGERSEEWYVRTADNSVDLYVLERGTGAPVVVLHGGFGAEHSYLLPSFEGLEDEFRFISYDQRGSLRSPGNPDTISIEQHVDDLEAVRMAIGIERLTLYAHSMGTHLALHYLKKYPDRVGAMILVGAMPIQSGVHLDPSLLPAINAASAEVRSFLGRPQVAEELAKLGCELEACSPRDATRAWRISFAAANIFHVDRWREVRGGRAFYNPVAAQAAADTFSNDYDFVPAVTAHPFSITVINGSHDFADFGGVWFGPFASSNPRIHYTMLPDAGHNAWIDQPLQFEAALRIGLQRSLP
jgi:pimeloyl-ACP methyl ester carboxylesterase